MSSKSEQTRKRILQATLDLLETGAGNGVRMTDIAGAVGITRQALYLHFATRAELLMAATQYLDEIKDVESRLAPSREASSGIARLDAFVAAWANYIPEIYGLAKALLAMQETDDVAAAVWCQRMQDMKEGCAAAVEALAADATLTPSLTADEATDLMWAMLSVRNWEVLTRDCQWPQAFYVENMVRNCRALLTQSGTR